MRISKRIIAFVLILMLALSTSVVNADSNKSNGNNKFSDVNSDHWAKNYVELMSELGIINGYKDGSFKPSAVVTRAEFAKMMVLTLNLELYKPSTATFLDVTKKDWEFPFVETGKFYLTGFRTANGDYFRPNQTAVREDMAVAIVKGLGINPDTVDLTILNKFTDVNTISPNLKKYVAAAVKEGIMEGDNNTFDPQSALTRAEAATLLAKLIVNEKVTYEQDIKVTYDAIEQVTKSTPTLYSVAKDGYIYLEWSKVLVTEGFKYYKVVVSQKDSTPTYPEQGYMVAISDPTVNKAKISEGASYTDGDFGGNIKAGESYYVSITAVYDKVSYTSNVRTVKVPGLVVVTNPIERTPVMEYELKDNGVQLKWSKVNASNFLYYKVVLSKNDMTPSYPENGYLTAISDVNTTGYFVQKSAPYNNGDFDGVVKNEPYYVTITAVYKDGTKITTYTSLTNAITVPNN